MTKRRTQTIPAATRRKVMWRDHKRCVVPGCRQTRYVDVHHLDPRAEGGGHDEDNLAVLCGAHHRAVHSGRMIIEGRVSTGLTFRHADGATYGRAVSPLSQDLQSKLFATLRGMGFRERETRQALADVRSKLPGEADAAVLLRAALGLLTGN